VDEPHRLVIENSPDLQDLALLDSFKSSHDPAALRAETARRFNDTSPEAWRSPRPG